MPEIQTKTRNPNTNFAHFAIELNDLEWRSLMAFWKALARGFPTGYLRPPFEVTNFDREVRQSGFRYVTKSIFAPLATGLGETDPELKGGWIEPPAAKWRFFGVLG